MTDGRHTSLSDRKRSFAIFARYVLFAIVAGAANLATQAIVFDLAPIQPLALSILLGTGAGFVVKYLLDKHWIFFDRSDGIANEIYKIVLYGGFSVAMTLIFWGFEIAFLAIGGTSLAKYIGAVIGLTIGNLLKFLLDSTITFNAKARSWS
jgi:putative flippase GtrA